MINYLIPCVVIFFAFFHSAESLSRTNKLGQCCHHVMSEIDLAWCVQNTSAALNREGIKRVGIVTFSTDDIKKYSVYAHAVNAIYAEHNNYEIKFLDPANFPEYDSSDMRWSKINILRHAVSNNDSTWGNDVDYFMWIDADVIFLDIDMHIEDFFVKNPNAQLIISAESAGSKTLVNTGTIIVKRSLWTMEFLTEWWGSTADRINLSDQERFDKIYLQRKNQTGIVSTSDNPQNAYISIEDAIVILPPDSINSEPPAKFRQQPSNPVLHLMGESISYREHVFRVALMNLCGYIHGTACEIVQHSDLTNVSPVSLQCSELDESELLLPPQLGITTDVMQQWSYDIYSKEFRRLYELFVEKAETGLNNLSESSALANAARHYTETIQVQEELRLAKLVADATERSEEDANYSLSVMDEIVNTRKAVYQVIAKNFVMHKAEAHRYFNETGKVVSYWPEMIRNVVSAAQALMLTPHGVTSSEKIVIAGVILDHLYGLYEIIGESQQEIVYHMVAMHYKDMASIYRDAGEIAAAMESARLSVNMSQEIANIAGEHVMVGPLATLASVYVKMGQFDNSLEAIQKAGDIATWHLGRWHDMVMELRLNYAVIALEARRIDVALVHAQEAREILLHSNKTQNKHHLKAVEALLAEIESQSTSSSS